MSILILAELSGNTIAKSTLHALTAATELAQHTGTTITVVVAGHGVAEAAAEIAKYAGVGSVLAADAACYEHGLAENLAPLLQEIIRDHVNDGTHLLASGSTFSKNILPRVAALLDVPMLSEVTQIIDAQTFVRPCYAGNALATVASTAPIKVLSIRSTTFAAATDQADHDAPITKLTMQHENTSVAFVGHEHVQSERPELTSARVVIAGGRGLGNAENFKLLEALAIKLNAAIGASRAAVDAGFVPNEYQVGQTGKVVAPELYIAIGISGAIQHLAGMKDSKVIVAINKDADAPIFEIADYGLVMDLFEALPKLTEAL